MTVQVDVQIVTDEEYVPAADEIAIWVERAMRAAGRLAAAEVSVRVVDAAEMQQLNRDFRDQDKPTNVLSFPAGNIDGLPDDEPVPLGDIVVCASVVAREVEQQGKIESDHWAHMIVHGTLHLLNFDHETDAEATAMESLETRVLTDNGVANPYGESPQEN